MRNKIVTNDHQLGQTLIETIVAIFVLTAGLISAVGLGAYSFRSTDNASKQVVGTALAREGVEVVQNIRDTNWLTAAPEECNYMGQGQFCHEAWLDGIGGEIEVGDWGIDMNASTGAWQFSTPSNSGLYYNPTTGIYSTVQNSGSRRSIYSRRISIARDTTTPPFSGSNPLIVVTSTVWWTGNKCLPTNNPATLAESCKVVLQLNLTNWKNY
jgi:Tfp pilus assembly protein PilV